MGKEKLPFRPEPGRNLHKYSELCLGSHFRESSLVPSKYTNKQLANISKKISLKNTHTH